MSSFTHAANISEWSVRDVFIHVGNSERGRVQAAALQGWKTRHISAILTFYIAKLITQLCGNSAQ